GGAGRHRAEAMFRGAVHREDAVEVLRLDAAATPEGPRDAGVEARVWRNGRLQASRWWAQPPDPAAWQAFARGAGLGGDAPMPEPVPAPLHARPLDGGGSRLALAGRLGEQRALLTATVGMLVLSMLVWQGASAARIAWRAASVDRQIDALS